VNGYLRPLICFSRKVFPMSSRYPFAPNRRSWLAVVAPLAILLGCAEAVQAKGGEPTWHRRAPSLDQSYDAGQAAENGDYGHRPCFSAASASAARTGGDATTDSRYVAWRFGKLAAPRRGVERSLAVLPIDLATVPVGLAMAVRLTPTASIASTTDYLLLRRLRL
jgi:hypothetical protein